MNAVWILLVIVFTNNGVAIEKVEFDSRSLCTGAKDHLVTNFEGRNSADVIRATCMQTRRNSP